MIAFTVEGQPVAKARARVTMKGGFARAYTPAKTVNYETIVGIAGKLAIAGIEPLIGAIVMGLSFYMGVPKSWSKKKREMAITGYIYPTSKPDLDNYTKLICDALNGICYLDDSQIVDHVISKRYSEFPRVEIRINSINIT